MSAFCLCLETTDAVLDGEKANLPFLCLTTFPCRFAATFFVLPAPTRPVARFAFDFNVCPCGINANVNPLRGVTRANDSNRIVSKSFLIDAFAFSLVFLQPPLGPVFGRTAHDDARDDDDARECVVTSIVVDVCIRPSGFAATRAAPGNVRIVVQRSASGR